MTARLTTDWKLFTPILLILAFGLVMVYSASSVVAEIRFGKPTYEFALRQLVFAVIGVGAMLVLKAIDYRKLNQAQCVLVPVGLVGMLLVLVIAADPVAHRWFRVAGMQVQPSEFAKVAMVLFLAWFVSQREAGRANINDRHTILPASLVVGILVGLIAIGDLGTAIVLLVPAAAVFFVAGIERRYFYLTILLGVLLFFVFLIQKPYRILRVMAYAGITEEKVEGDPRLKWLASSIADSRATRDADHQPHQAKIAVGRGGVTGAGLGQSNQKLGFLPEAHTDFIFAVVGEETGLMGCTALLGGYFLIFWRGIRLYWRAGDRFGRYLALGVVTLFTTQAFFNISVVVGVLPTKGIALPLVSYGGSALICTLMLLGLLLSVSDRNAEA